MDSGIDLQLLSYGFVGGEALPAQYTCSGENNAPPLAWRGVPEGARSLVLMCDDPDAGSPPFCHWLVYDIPLERDFIPEGFQADEQEDWGTAGRNDFGSTRYEGPCPPPGEAHRYYFRLYALDRETGLPPGATRAQVMDKMRDHILRETELIGTFSRLAAA